METPVRRPGHGAAPLQAPDDAQAGQAAVPVDNGRGHREAALNGVSASVNGVAAGKLIATPRTVSGRADDAGADADADRRDPQTHARSARRGIRLLHGFDAVTLFASMVLIATVRYGIEWPVYPRSHYLIGFAIATAIHVVVYDLGGLYEPEQRIEAPRWLPRAAWQTAIAVLITGTVGLATGRYLMPRGNLVALAVVASLLIALNRTVARAVRKRSYRGHKPRVLLVGTSRDVELARRHITDTAPGLDVAGAVPDTAELCAAMDRCEATDVLLLSDDPIESIYPDPFEELEVRNVCVYRRVRPADTLLGLQRSLQVAGMPFVALRMHAMPRHRLRLKRLLDLGLLLALSPFILAAVAFTALFTRIRVGPGVIYRQTRVGRNGRSFTLVKFRTMHNDAERELGPVIAVEGDTRVVAGMSWIRAARLDELPQFFNVLRGEMSIVGPRPERIENCDELEKLLPGYRRRHDVPPGITGLAQTRAHYQTDAAYKLGHDLQYVINWSPILDLSILVRSVAVVIRREGR